MQPKSSIANNLNKQAAKSMSNLKMIDSPVKDIDSSTMDKENNISILPSPSKETSPFEQSIVKTVKPVETPKVTPGVKAGEAGEPLLQENPHRFVLFPIKYHEVWNFNFVYCQSSTNNPL